MFSEMDERLTKMSCPNMRWIEQEVKVDEVVWL